MELQNLTDRLRENGYKITPQRLGIIKLIISRKDHPTADQIYEEIKGEFPTISLGTVYKTLHLLKKIGVIQELGFEEGSVRYDPDVKLHINMVCVKCGKITDHLPKKLEDFWASIISALKVTPLGQRIDLYYECNNCHDKRTKK